MDFWSEILGLTIDLVFLFLSYSEYSFYSETIKRLEKGKQIGINPDPTELAADGHSTCAIVKGFVKPLTEEYVHSYHSPSEKGLIQKITMTEHDVYRNATGLWFDKKHVIQEMVSSVPFAIAKEKYVVQVTQINECYILDLNAVSTKFEPTEMGFVDRGTSFFNGVREQGVATTEELLKEGMVITGIGELSVVNGVKTLAPPANGSAYILTVASIPSLLRKMKEEQATMRVLCVAFGMVGAVFLGFIIKRMYKLYIDRVNELEMARRLEMIRRERRQTENETGEMPDENGCVVCRSNPREIILLPCGHFCLCGECSKSTGKICVICRTIITSRYAVFF